MFLFANRVFADTVSKHEVVLEEGEFLLKKNPTPRGDTGLCTREDKEDVVGEPRDAWGHRKPGEKTGVDSPSRPLAGTQPVTPRTWASTLRCLRQYISIA